MSSELRATMILKRDRPKRDKQDRLQFMSIVPDADLFAHSARVKGKVVIITGAANGIGKEAAERFAQHGAKVLIADWDIKNAEKVVEEINANGGTSTCIKCDVTSWDDQLSLFEHATNTYGSVDIVIPNAGIAETRGFGSATMDKHTGKLQKPNLKTLDVNITGAFYTVHLAMHYLFLTPGTLKSLVLIGSMASWQSIPYAPLYSASKHAVLGLMRALSTSSIPHSSPTQAPLRLACVHPFFVSTNILEPFVLLFLAGIPKNTVQRVAGAVFYAATNPDEKTNGAAWLLADDGEVLVALKEELTTGLYVILNQRLNKIKNFISGILFWRGVLSDVAQVVGKPPIIAGLGMLAAMIAWSYS